MDNFFSELKRRHIYRVATAYTVVAWVVIQLVSNITPMLNLPSTVGTVVLVLLAAGFPIALLFAWIRELAPAHGATTRAVTGNLDWALIAALVAVLVTVSYQQLAPSRATVTVNPQPGVEAARNAAASPASTISVAVLPFANLSDDRQQEFFSDGITEEITAALAKIADLRVVARTSAFQFKGQNQDMRAVGQALGATHLIEGSVRKAGTRLRITAQLIKTDDGTHIWSENYDRELADVFAIQENIATAIAGALRMPLGLKPGENLVVNRSIDPESYQQFLRAKPLVRARRLGVPQAIAILEPLVARNPDYAPAWAQLSEAYSLTPNYHRARSIDELRRIVDEFLSKAETAARRAIQLDSNLADGYMSLARLQARRGKYLLAEDFFSKGLALDPNDAAGLNTYSSMLAGLGRLKEALAMKQQVLAVEPYVPGFKTDTAEMLWLNGQDDAAIAMLKEIPSAISKLDLTQIYASQGRFSEAADILLEIPSADKSVLVELVAEPARILRTAPTRISSPQSLPSKGPMAFIYLYIGEPERVLDGREDSTKAGYFSPGGTENAYLWHSSYASVRKTERFKAWVRAEGYVDYWRTKGWPEFCQPTTGDDFECN